MKEKLEKEILAHCKVEVRPLKPKNEGDIEKLISYTFEYEGVNSVYFATKMLISKEDMDKYEI
jgi:hypothetical protein